MFISGIGCSGRFAVLHEHVRDARHPRSRLRRSRPGWRVRAATCRSGSSPATATSLSIGGNHLIHALRRNMPIKIILFNNEIYGLTKGQESPTSELGKVTKSTPFGVVRSSLQSGCARGRSRGDVRRQDARSGPNHMAEVLRAAAHHKGAALVEIYQNCPVFNDGAFSALTEKGRQRGKSDQARGGQADPLRCGRRARGGDGL